MKKTLKIILGLAILATVALSCVACSSVGTWVDQMTCEHKYDGGVVTKSATCSAYGELTKTCKTCKKTEKTKVDKLDHVVVRIETEDSTCVKTGLTDYTKCSVCDTVITEPQEIPAKGHLVVFDNAVEPTCLDSGLSKGSHCSLCSEVLTKQNVIPAKGHTLVAYEKLDPTCDNDGHSAYSECTTCNVQYGYEVYPSLHKSYEGGYCGECGGIPLADIPVEMLEDERYFTKTELKSGDQVALDKVVLYIPGEHAVVVKPADGKQICLYRGYCFDIVAFRFFGNYDFPSEVVSVFDDESNCSAYYFPTGTKMTVSDSLLISEHKNLVDYTFTDMNVGISYITVGTPESSIDPSAVIYAYTPVV